MPQTITRKCSKCKELIAINREHINGVAYYKNAYYHTDCFVDYCQGRAARKGSSPIWQDMLNDMTAVEEEAKEKCLYQFNKDDLNEWILSHYDIITIPNRFWNIVADLENGIYNKKKCKQVPTKILFETWRWGQKNLDSINRNNKKNRNGPKNDADRINYDLAIVLKHIGDYKKYLAKLEAEEAESKARAKEQVKIDYSKIGSNTQKQEEGLGDISDILDEFF